MLRRSLILLLSLAALSGCASGPALVRGPGLMVTSASELPPPAHIELGSEDRPYRLGPFDKIQVHVFGQPDLSREEVLVDASGAVSLPLVGPVNAGGLAPAEFADLVAQRLQGLHVRDPQVSVNLVEANSQVVTVDGAVKEPGVYPVLGRTTLMRTVATAKGLTEFAEADEVVVFRNVEDQRMAALYSLAGIRTGAYPDPEIFAGDVVVVGDSPTRRMFRDIVAAGGLVTAPLVAIIR